MGERSRSGSATADATVSVSGESPARIPAPLPTTPAPVELRQLGDVTEIRTDSYTLRLDRGRFTGAPYARLEDRAGRPWSTLSLLSSVHALASPDETYRVEDYEVSPGPDQVTVLVPTSSSAWDEHELQLVCRPDALELSVRVRGQGRLTDLHLLGGEGTLPDGAAGSFASSVDFASLLVPAPGEPVQLVRPSSSAGQLGVVGDADPGRLHAVFSPSPLVFGFGRGAPAGRTDIPAGEWLGLSLRAPVAELTFTTMAYRPLDGGFSLRLAYEGHTEVEGEWRSPVLVLRPATRGADVLRDSRDDLVRHGFATDAPHPGPAWWQQPIFCGWGAQCGRAAVQAGRRPVPVEPGTGPPPSVGVDPAVEHVDHAVTSSAAGLAREDVYEEFLARLAAHHLEPGTVVIDDRWQAAYGTAEPDREHWPDLRGWIARQHRAGRKVLLWWKAWDPSGLPVQECITDPAGRAVSVDPANPAYREHLGRIIASLLSPAGLDADGVKIDFTQRAPSGATLRGAPGAWGIAALHLLLRTLHDAAHQAKPDALVITHAVHPSFADVSDMVRLNDVSRADVAGHPVPVVDQLRFRAAIARAALPHHLLDTDQWPMPNRAEWRRYVEAQAEVGVPALYYLETIDRTGEPIGPEDLAAVAASWSRYRAGLGRPRPDGAGR